MFLDDVSIYKQLSAKVPRQVIDAGCLRLIRCNSDGLGRVPSIAE